MCRKKKFIEGRTAGLTPTPRILLIFFHIWTNFFYEARRRSEESNKNSLQPQCHVLDFLFKKIFYQKIPSHFIFPLKINTIICHKFLYVRLCFRNLYVGSVVINVDIDFSKLSPPIFIHMIKLIRYVPSRWSGGGNRMLLKLFLLMEI